MKRESSMAEQNTAVFGIFSDRFSTADAIKSLKTAGFRNTDIIAVFPDEIGTWQFSSKTGTKLVEGAAAGLCGGLLISGVVLWVLTALSFVSLDSISVSVSLAVGGVLGSLLGGTVGRRISDYDRRYEGRVRRGDILVSVQCEDPNWTDKAKDILRNTGGDDVSVSDKVTVDFARTNRILVRPASEKTTTSVLRLVKHENLRREPAELRRSGTRNSGSSRISIRLWRRRS
jgi:hypothetical protein